jgi:hypothetical protein
VSGPRLAALAQGRAWVPLWRDPDVAAALHAVLLGPQRDPGFLGVAAVRLLPDDGGTVILELGEAHAASPQRCRQLAESAAAALASDPVVRERCPGGLAIGVLPAR